MEFQDRVLFGVSALGFISLCHHLFAFLKWLYKMFIRKPKDLRDYGSWAMITGSTNGIGRALAFELASKGLNLVCVGRNPTKLESTAAEIHHKFGERIMIRNITLDFVKSGPNEISSAIDHGIQGLDIGLLVNNVGIAHAYPRFFHEIEQELLETMIRENVEAVIWVTRAVISEMMKKKKGAIVNIGSGSSVTVSSYPLFTLYAASKA
ncbi:hypothetical protein CRG98_002580 [Punica granatum]|nr:hypothetical protein CRG98_002580 [Punica granatum]